MMKKNASVLGFVGALIGALLLLQLHEVQSFLVVSSSANKMSCSRPVVTAQQQQQQQQQQQRRTCCYLFVNNNKPPAGQAPSNKQTTKTTTKKKNDNKPDDDDDDDPMWKKALRVIITGSPDGISMLGKPQIKWSTMKTEYTAGTGTSSNRRRWSTNGGRSKNTNKK